MAIALVGTIGAVSTGTSGGAIGPSWGAGSSQSPNNLLVFWVGVTGTATLPVTPTGWNIAKQQAGTSCSATIYWKIAAGGDLPPTIAAITSGVISGRLGEYSGNVTASPVASSGGAAGTTSGLAATNAVVDSGSGALMVSVASAFISSARNNAAWGETYVNGTAIQVNNSGTSTANHYGFSYAITTANAVVDKDTFAFTTTQLTGACVALASFNANPVLTATGTGAITFGGSGTAAITAVSTSGTGAITFGGAGTARVQVNGTGTGAIAFGGTGTGKVTVNPTGTGAIVFGGTGTATVQVSSTGTGAIAFDGAGVATVPNPKISTLVDDFSSGSLSPKWQISSHSSSSGASAVVAGGQLTLTGPSAAIYVQSVGLYDLTSSQISSQAVSLDPSGFEIIPIGVLSSSGAVTDAASIWVYQGLIGAGNNASGFFPYDPAVHKWFRMRESGGTSYYDYSTDGVTWTNFYSQVNSFSDMTAVFALTSLSFGPPLVLDNVNVVQLNVIGTGAITFDGSGTATYGVLVTASGTGAIAFGGTGTATYFVPATGTGAITFGGSGTAKVTVNPTGTGAITFGGSGTGKVTVNPTGTGAITFAGSGTASYVVTATGTGAIVFAGSGSPKVGLSTSGTGAITFGGTGTAAYGSFFPASGTGAIVFGGSGTAVVHPLITATGTGAIVFGASGAAQLSISTSGSGAIVFGGSGTATFHVTVNATGTGAIVFNASGTAIVTTIATGTGAIVFNGVGVAAITAVRATGIGAILFDGTGIVVSTAKGFPTLAEQIAALAGVDSSMIGATGYAEVMATARLEPGQDPIVVGVTNMDAVATARLEPGQDPIVVGVTDLDEVFPQRLEGPTQ